MLCGCVFSACTHAVVCVHVCVCMLVSDHSSQKRATGDLQGGCEQLKVSTRNQSLSSGRVMQYLSRGINSTAPK